MLPFVSYKSSKAQGRRAKHKLFPLPVGRLTKTLFPSKKLNTALFCWLFKDEKPNRLAAFVIDNSIFNAQYICMRTIYVRYPYDVKSLAAI